MQHLKWRSIGLIIALVSFPACIMPALAADRENDALLPTGRIRLFQSHDRVLVMMRIGTGELVPMVFDTGSDGHSFDTLIVARNHLRKVGTTVEVDGSTGRRRTLPTYAIPDVSIGGLRAGRIIGVSLDYDRDDAMGIISPEMFRGRLVSVDFSANRADVLSKTPAHIPTGASAPYQGGLPATDVKMPDGSITFANFDTGFDGAISLPIEMIKTVPLMAAAKIVGRYKTIATEGPVFGGQVRGDIVVGPLTLKNPQVTFIGDAMNIGLPLMRRLRIMLDPEGKRAWVSCASGTERC